MEKQIPTPPRSATEQRPKKKRIARILFAFVLLFLTWLVLSGRFDTFHIALGTVSCLIISIISSDLVFETVDFGILIKQVPRFFLYLPWLLIQVLKANLHVLKLSFHPNLHDRINPRVMRFKSRLQGEFALTTFANSITLTPGTITVYATEYGDFEVHVIDDFSGEGIPGEMEARIARIFES